MKYDQPIESLEDAKAFIEELQRNDLMFHFEDSPADVIDHRTGKPTFKPAEAEKLEERLEELYEQDWESIGHECPIGYALQVMLEVTRRPIGHPEGAVSDLATIRRDFIDREEDLEWVNCFCNFLLMNGRATDRHYVYEITDQRWLEDRGQHEEL